MAATDTPNDTPRQFELPRASYSRMSVYKQCPRQYKLKYIDQLPEADRPIQLDRSGKPKPSAAERGSWIHDQMDHYINNRSPYDIDKHNGIKESQCSTNKNPIPLLPELFNIRMEVEELKTLKSERPSTTFTEQKWFYDMDWNEIPSYTQDNPSKPIPMTELDYAVIAIIDCMVIDDYTDPDYITARIIDLKSGKSFNNESKHAAQLNLYAAAAMCKFPEIQEFHLELLYCDEGKHKIRTVLKQNASAYRNYWEQQVLTMFRDDYYDPQASQSNCRFCPRRPEDKPNKWVNGDSTCTAFIEHPNDTKWRLAQKK